MIPELSNIFPETIITMMIQLPSVGGLAFAVWTLASALNSTLETIEELSKLAYKGGDTNKDNTNSQAPGSS